ncbi:RNA polymerase II transcriptional coactivator KELP [Canna indica]|uniref:RNA polymerase II transcriptional coactivator KELP n=1 Tax=Canna indica TaxID=4628 RepID=A0AAQ3Q9T9_9LILI|nr:RNA polymerase II transcriptional coactivator KELP [Canna indica]
MDEETKQKIEETVLEILRDADMTATTEYKVRTTASERLGIDLSRPDCKLFVRSVVESFLIAQNNEDAAATSNPQKEEEIPQAEQPEQDQVEEDVAEEEEDPDDGAKKRQRAPKEYDDEGDLIVCRLSNKRRVTIQDFRGKTLVSIREYYMKDGKELPSSKGISLTVEQWEAFRNAVPAIVSAIKKLEDSD